ncbi:MAG: GTPase [Thermoprotei archaeon]|nr:MAG: GTPase [Thermoprotei archaeon]
MAGSYPVGQALYLVVMGPAGSGKSTLSSAFGRWIEEQQGFSVAYVNLDPGAEQTPYAPDVDVRKYVRVRDVMRERGLGPNGALIVSMELLYRRREEIMVEVDNLDADFVIVDTPGQMELFVFHETGPAFSREFAKRGAACALMLFDASLAARPSELVTLKLMGLVAQLRLDLPTVVALNKSDLEQSRAVSRWLEDPRALVEDLSRERGVVSELAAQMAALLDEYSVASRIPMISALRGEGLDELYDLIHEVWCTCGDLT